MQRRKFMIGMGALTSGTIAAVGTGAYSRVQSDRDAVIQIANDEDAYLGLSPLETPNSENYVELDENGHLAIDVGDNGEGAGVNSNSRTEFDGMFEVTNQGTDEATISMEISMDADDDRAIEFYDEDGNAIARSDEDVESDLELDVGESEVIGLATETFGVDATEDEPLFDGQVTFTADAPGAGEE